MKTSRVLTITKRELKGLFSTPLAYIFLIFFLSFSAAFAFYLGNFFGIGEASLKSFFQFQPWLYLFFMPAISMKMWAEERKSGTIELLFTLPIKNIEIILGKFLSVWIFAIIGIVLTFPMWISVNILGDPDNLTIFSGFLGSILLTGSLISICLAISSFTNSQVVAFILSISVLFFYLMSGTEFVLDFVYESMPFLADSISNLSALTHFAWFSEGVIEIKSLLFFLSTIITWLVINYLAIKHYRN